MKFRVSVEASALRARIDGLIKRVQDLSPALKASASFALTAAADRIKSRGGGTWPSTVEQSKGAPLQRTGRLLGSLTLGGPDNLLQDIPGGIRAGTNLRSEDGFNYPYALQYGTGIYGPSGQPIKPKQGKYLVFEVNGHKVFARSVKGAPRRPYLYIDGQVANSIRSVFGTYLMRGSSDVEQP